MEVIGYIGNISLALCGVPLAYRAFKDKAIDISFWFLVLWTVGEIFTLLYVLTLKDFPLALNYSVNLLCLSIVWRYRNG